MTEFVNDLLGEAYVRVDHRSGLPIYVFPKKAVGTYAIFATRYGSVDSPAGNGKDQDVKIPDGIAHFLEHKLFENEDGSDSFARFSEYGADANAYTSYTQTAYLFNCSERFEESLRELLTFVTHPYFTDQTVRKEQGIIAEEIRMYDDNPWECSYRKLLCALYRKHPIRKNICGSAASIRKITPALLYRCYHEFYRLSNMVLVVCGDVTPEAVCAVADECLPKKSDGGTATRAAMPEESPKAFRHRVETRMQVTKPIFQIGVKDTEIPADPAERLRRETALTLLDEILFTAGGEFFSDLYESGKITPSFSYGYSITESCAFHCISGESDDPDEILGAFFAYIEKMKKQGLPDEDFERCRRVLYADEVRAFDSVGEIANRLFSATFDGVGLFDTLPLYNEITKAELERLLEHAFDREKVALSVVFAPDGEK